MASITADEYSKALESLKTALGFVAKASTDDEFKVARDACIQRFEFSIELAWKVSAKIMGSRSTAPKMVIREMAQNGLISNPELWLEFVDARNRTSHTYDENVAKEVFEVVKSFLPEGEKLISRFRSK